MRKLHKLTQLPPRFVRYLLVGTIMLGVGTVVLELLMRAGISAGVAFFVKNPITSPPHYFLHRLITWHDTRHAPVKWQKCRYAAAKVGTTLLGYGLFKITAMHSVHALWANAVSFVAVGALQYAINHRAVFIQALHRTSA